MRDQKYFHDAVVENMKYELEKFHSNKQALETRCVHYQDNLKLCQVRINQLKEEKLQQTTLHLQDKTNLKLQLDEETLNLTMQITKSIQDLMQLHKQEIKQIKRRNQRQKRKADKKKEKLEEELNELKKANNNNHSLTTMVCESKIQVCPNPARIITGWWNGLDILSFDCECVHLLNGQMKAATVSICDSTLKEVYSAMIYHEPGSFKVNHKTKSITGFTKDSLKDGRPFDEIGAEVGKFLEGKFVICFVGRKDFEFLNLDAGKYEYFDLAEYYRKPKPNEKGKDLGEPISLKRLCAQLLKLKIQKGPHSAKEDSDATMRLFMGDYVPRNEGNMDKNKTDFKQFAHIL